MALEKIRKSPETNRLYGQVLKGVYGLTIKRLYDLPYATRMGIKETAFSMVSALETGHASLPEKTDIHRDMGIN